MGNLFYYVAPSSPPSEVRLQALSPTSIAVTWMEVPLMEQNGVITAYEVFYLPLNHFSGLISSNSTHVSGSELSVTLLNLEEYVNYSVSVRAFASIGPGPFSEEEIELTLEAGEFATFLNMQLVLCKQHYNNSDNFKKNYFTNFSS